MYPTPPDSPVQKRKSSYNPPFIHSSQIQLPMSYGKSTRRRSSRRSTRSKLTSNSGDLYGRRLYTPHNPPMLTLDRPVFRTVRIQTTSAGINVITAADISLIDVSDYNLNTAVTTNRFATLNVISIKLWDPSGAVARIIGPASAGSFDVTDQGTSGADASRVGYLMPMAFRTTSVGATSTSTLFTVDASAKSVIDVYCRFQ